MVLIASAWPHAGTASTRASGRGISSQRHCVLLGRRLEFPHHVGNPRVRKRRGQRSIPFFLPLPTRRSPSDAILQIAVEITHLRRLPLGTGRNTVSGWSP